MEASPNEALKCKCHKTINMIKHQGCVPLLKLTGLTKSAAFCNACDGHDLETLSLWDLRHQCLLQLVIRLLSTGMLPGGQVSKC